MVGVRCSKTETTDRLLVADTQHQAAAARLMLRATNGAPISSAQLTQYGSRASHTAHRTTFSLQCTIH